MLYLNKTKKIEGSLCLSYLGLTLIELLIALAISVIFTSAMIQAYMSSQMTFSVNRNQTQLQEEGRTVIQIFNNSVGQAGYRNKEGLLQDSKTIFPTDTLFIEDQVIAIETSAEKVSLHTRFQGESDPFVTDCLGKSHQPHELVTQSLIYEIETSTLTCEVSCTNLSVENKPICTTETVWLTDQLGQIDFAFGVDKDADKVVNQYVATSELSTLQTNILAIKISAIMESSVNVHPVTKVQTFNDVFGNITQYEDQRLREMFTETLSVRNRLP